MGNAYPTCCVPSSERTSKSLHQMNRQDAKDAKIKKRKRKREKEECRALLLLYSSFSFFFSFYLFSLLPWRPWRLGGSIGEGIPLIDLSSRFSGIYWIYRTNRIFSRMTSSPV